MARWSVSGKLAEGAAGHADAFQALVRAHSLAFAALPLYVHLPAMYGALPGVSLAAVGAVLLATRVFDAAVDPLIGWYSDRLGSRRRLVVAGLPLLAAGFFLLCRPPPGAGLLSAADPTA